MEAPEVPLEQSQEEITHHAHVAEEGWIMGVALTAAVLAVGAAITALLAEHHANEAMILQIQSSDQWNYYQAKGIKGNVLQTKIDVLSALGKSVESSDQKKLDQYRQDQESIRHLADEKQRESEEHLRHHSVLARGVTMFQVAIAVGAIAVLTKKQSFWFGSLALGLLGAAFLAWGIAIR